MTATPIPRTLAMAAYADLDTSIIDELPPGRQPVRTVALPDKRREEVIARVREACTGGQQAYWVCPLIEESEVLNYEAAEARHELLVQALPELRIGLVHGRMKPPARDKVMRAFKSGEVDVLVRKSGHVTGDAHARLHREVGDDVALAAFYDGVDEATYSFACEALE